MRALLALICRLNESIEKLKINFIHNILRKTFSGVTKRIFILGFVLLRSLMIRETAEESRSLVKD
jgi:hypothetical protein